MRNNFLKVIVLMLCLSWLGNAAAFDFEDVIAAAQELATRSYQPPPEIPRFLRELGYDEYQKIRFDEEKSLWRENRSRFQVMMFPPGMIYTHPVTIHIVDGEGVQELPYRKGDFIFPDPDLEKRVPPDLGYAGFELSYPLSETGEQNQFLVFAGASYFRAVGKDHAWGISGRGIAVNTGLARGEQFPSFTSFWLVRPSPDATTMRFYALLDGESLTGAYQFDVTPGETTTLQVNTVIIPRDPIDLPGIAPLTSMFFYGAGTTRPAGEWRPSVHDSGGLLLHDGASDEWLWRPLINPRRLEMDYFRVENLRGFGLLQRSTAFEKFQDLEARYDRRPSTWVAARDQWEPGNVVLVQLPTAVETNDNIVAFWSPDSDSPLVRGEPHRFAYDVAFGRPELANSPMGQAVNTFVGDGSILGGGTVEGAYRVIVDFRGGPLDRLQPRAAVSGNVTALEDGEILEHYVEYNAPLRAWRLSFLARPASERPLALRAFLSEADGALTETWTYRLPADNDILSAKRR